jgi:hypothetical protein
MSAAALVDVAKEEVAAARSRSPGVPVVLNAMFHNVEVIPGASPYAETESEARTILERVAALLAFAASESMRFVSLSDVAELFA